MHLIETSMMANSLNTPPISDDDLLDFIMGYGPNETQHHHSTQHQMEQDKINHQQDYYSYYNYPTPQYHHQQSSPPNHNHPDLLDYDFNETNRNSKRQKLSSFDNNTGVVERWEPGEIVDDNSDTKSQSSTTSSKHNNVDDIYIVKENFSSSDKPLPKKRGPRPRKLSREEKRQKRVDANDRERQRMGKLNSAFDSLRHLLPKHDNDRELSKFETIQIAKSYICSLNEMLSQSDGNFFNESNLQNHSPCDNDNGFYL